LDAGPEPCRELCFRALSVTDSLGNGRELVAHVEWVARVPKPIEAQEGIGSDIGCTFVALDECLRLRDANREKHREDHRIILATEYIRHARTVDGGFKHRLTAERHWRGACALHDFCMERDDFHNAEVPDRGHQVGLLLREGAVARLILMPRLLEDLPQLWREHRAEFEGLYINEQRLPLVEVQSLNLFLWNGDNKAVSLPPQLLLNHESTFLC